MNRDFRNGAQSAGIDCRFMFDGNTYHLRTLNDSIGGLAKFELNSETVTKGMRISLQSESRMMSDGLAAGVPLDALIEQFARKSGERVRPVIIIGENRSFAATNVWNAAMQIMEQKYRRDPVVRIRAKMSKFRVLDGGMA